MPIFVASWWRVVCGIVDSFFCEWHFTFHRPFRKNQDQFAFETICCRDKVLPGILHGSQATNYTASVSMIVCRVELKEMMEDVMDEDYKEGWWYGGVLFLKRVLYIVLRFITLFSEGGSGSESDVQVFFRQNPPTLMVLFCVFYWTELPGVK